jgi:hypothetical protein
MQIPLNFDYARAIFLLKTMNIYNDIWDIYGIDTLIGMLGAR